MHKWGLPPWRVEFECPATSLPARTAVAIVGAGLTGLSAAYHLRRAQPDWPVAVLEAATVGEGASGRSGGILLEDTAAGPMAGFENCLAGVSELVARERIECGLVLNGCWEISHGKSAAVSLIRWDDGGVPLRVYRAVPGGVVDPGKLVAGLARAALAAGATVHEHCPVTAIDFGRSGAVSLQAGGGSLIAEWVVLATNAYSFELSELHLHAVPVMAVAVATAPLGPAAIRELGLKPRLPFYTEDIPYLWGRLTEQNLLILGSGLMAPEACDVSQLTLDSEGARLLFSGLQRRIRRFHPVLKRVSFTHRWAGPIAISHDGPPVLYVHPRSPRVLVAAAYSGHGLAQAIRMGQLVARRISDG